MLEQVLENRLGLSLGQQANHLLDAHTVVAAQLPALERSGPCGIVALVRSVVETQIGYESDVLAQGGGDAPDPGRSALVQQKRSDRGEPVRGGWHKRRKRKPEISLEDLVSSDDEGSGGDVLEVLLIPDDGRAPSPEEELAYKQEMEALMAVFADRPDAQLVLMGRAEGLKGTELATFAELNASQLATVQRLISRRLAGYRRDE